MANRIKMGNNFLLWPIFPLMALLSRLSQISDSLTEGSNRLVVVVLFTRPGANYGWNY